MKTRFEATNSTKQHEFGEVDATKNAQNSPIGGAKYAIVGPASNIQRNESSPATSCTDRVSEALAESLSEAAKAGRWDLVATLATELEGRRTATTRMTGTVVDLTKEREKRGR